MVRASLEWMGRYGTLLMPAGIVIGCLFQPLAELLRPALAICVFLMLAVVLSRLEIQHALAHLRKPGVFLLSLVWAFIAMPVLFMAILQIFPQSPGLNAVLIIYATSPPNFGGAALAFLMGLDGALTVATIFASTAIHPVITPLFTEIYAPNAIPISGADLAVRLAGLIGGSSLAAWGLRSWLGAERRKAATGIFDGLNVIIMVVFAIALMDGIPARVLAQPSYSFALAVLATALHLGLNVITVAAFWVTGHRRAYTFGYTHSGRNIAVVMSVLGSAAPADAWLFFAMLQFPIYCLPMLLRPLYLHLLPQSE